MMALNPPPPPGAGAMRVPAPPLWTATVPLTVVGEDLHTSTIQAQATLTTRRDPRRTLDVLLTQEKDPFFHYSLSLAEDDYHQLKARQGLVVDFNVFPDKVIELLTLACQSPAHGKFDAQLVIGQRPTLQIVETNSFRQIVHLELAIVPGNDHAIKQYLASQVAMLKEELAMAKQMQSSTSATLQTQLDDAKQATLRIQQQLDDVRTAHAEELRKLAMQHAQELAKEREERLAERDRERQEHARQLRNVESQLESKIQSLTIKESTTSTSHEQLAAQNRALESSLAGIKDAHARLSADYAALQRTHQALQSEKAAADQDLYRCQHDLQRVTEQAGQLEAREHDRSDQLRSTQRDLEREVERREHLATDLEVTRAKLAQVESSLKEALGEITKGNAIIGKLQQAMKEQKAKLKTKNLVTLQQEKLLDERQGMLNQMTNEVTAVRKQLENAEAALAAKSTEVAQLKGEMERLEASKKEQQELVEFLHRQLNSDLLKNPSPRVGFHADEPVYTRPSTATGVPIPPAAGTATFPFRTLSPLKSQTATRLMESVHRSASPARSSAPPPPQPSLGLNGGGGARSMIPVPVAGTSVGGRSTTGGPTAAGPSGLAAARSTRDGNGAPRVSAFF
ncbi:Spindle assembly abnormal protein 6 [Allomyces arbusculus]|nr:Spindle assembly abnormal protein 6 [Allomyces arbusculus]